MSDTVLDWLFGGWLFGGSESRSHHAHAPRAIHADTQRETLSAPIADPIAKPIADRDAAANQLGERLRSGDVAAFDALYETLAQPVWRFARRLVGNDETAYDIMHDVFLGLWTERVSLAFPHGIRVYLFGAARRRAIQWLRREAIASRGIERLGRERAQTLDGDSSGDSSESPGDRIDGMVFRTALRRVVESLPVTQRTALALRWTHGLSFQEIAAVLGISEAGARQQVSRAQRAIRAAVAPLFKGEPKKL